MSAKKGSKIGGMSNSFVWWYIIIAGARGEEVVVGMVCGVDGCSDKRLGCFANFVC